VCGPKLIKDIAGAPDNVISFTAGLEEVRGILAVTSSFLIPFPALVDPSTLISVFLSHRKGSFLVL
jgi:hypothetical protein